MSLPELKALSGMLSFENDPDIYYIEMCDALGKGPLTFTVDLGSMKPMRDLYLDCGDESTSDIHDDQAARSALLNEFLSDLGGRGWKIDFIMCREVCRLGRWFQFERASFATEADMKAFCETFFKGIKAPKAKDTTEVVAKLAYTPEEARVEHSRIEAMAGERGWSRRTVAAYKAHVSRRITA